LSATTPDTGQPTPGGQYPRAASGATASTGSPPGAGWALGPRRHRDGAAHGRARTRPSSTSALPHVQERTPLLRQQPGVGRQRLRTGPSAALLLLGGRSGDLLGPPPDLPSSASCCSRSPRCSAGFATDQAWLLGRARPAGHRRRVRRADRTVADSAVTFPEGPPAQPRDGRVRRDERGRRPPSA